MNRELGARIKIISRGLHPSKFLFVLYFLHESLPLHVLELVGEVRV